MKNGTNGKKDRLDRIEELLQTTALQTAENAKQLSMLGRHLKASRDEHDREMKELRVLFKKMIQRVAV